MREYHSLVNVIVPANEVEGDEVGVRDYIEGIGTG
jgi:hypothetical protein